MRESEKATKGEGGQLVAPSLVATGDFRSVTFSLSRFLAFSLEES